MTDNISPLTAFNAATQQQALLALKQRIIMARNNALGMKTTFSYVERNAITQDETGLANLASVSTDADIPDENISAPDTAHFILQQNETNTTTQTYSTLEPEAKKYYETCNMLLRVLDTARAIDFVLAKQGHILQRETLHNTINAWIEQLNDNKITDIERNQAFFYRELITIMRAAGLNEGIDNNSTSAYAQLLKHYRIMAALLDPATVLHSEHTQNENNKHTETSVPITEKSTAQKTVLQEMKTIDTNPAKASFHTGKPHAYQIVNRAFADLAALDNRRLGAQARYAILPGVKNGYFNRYVCVKNGVSHQHDSLRSGSPVYVGKHEKDPVRLHAQTAENIRCLQKAAKLYTGNQNINLHVVQLVSGYLPNNNEHQIVAGTKAGVKQITDGQAHYSNIPINHAGVILHMNIAKTVDKKMSWPERISTFFWRLLTVFSKAARYALASDIARDKTEQASLAVHTCASGQDRTGTNLEYTHQLFCQEKADIPVGAMQVIRAKMGHSVAITEVANAGSPGLKNDSEATWLFGDDFRQNTYLKSANTNKAPAVDVLPNVRCKQVLPEDYVVGIENARSASAAKSIIEGIKDAETLLATYNQLDQQGFFDGQSTDPLTAGILGNFREHFKSLLSKKINTRTQIIDARADKIQFLKLWTDERARALLSHHVSSRLSFDQHYAPHGKLHAAAADAQSALGGDSRVWGRAQAVKGA